MEESVFLSKKKRPNYTATYTNHGIFPLFSCPRLQLGVQEFIYFFPGFSPIFCQYASMNMEIGLKKRLALFLPRV